MAKPAFIRASQNGTKSKWQLGIANQSQVPYNTTRNNYQQSKNRYPPEGALLQGEGETRKATRKYMN